VISLGGSWWKGYKKRNPSSKSEKEVDKYNAHIQRDWISMYRIEGWAQNEERERERAYSPNYKQICKEPWMVIHFLARCKSMYSYV